MANKAWERFRSKDASFGEKVAALTVSGIMKGKTTLGMGGRRRKKVITFKKAIGIAKRRLGGKVKKFPLQKSAQLALAALRKNKILGPQQRIIPIPKTGGILPLIPIFAALGALGSLGGGAAAVAKAVNEAKVAKQTLEEAKRHNKALEEAAVGKGLYLKPYKKGFGLYLRPYNPKNYH